MDSVKKTLILQGEYQVVKVLEDLDYSTVYLARDIEKNKDEFAVKEVQIRHDGSEDYKADMQKFALTAQPYTQLYHPYLAGITDYFYEDGFEYIVFNYIKGKRLQEILDKRSTPLREKDVLDLGMMIAGVLNYMHTGLDKPVLFSDLNPSNIVITPEGTLALTDYGLGKSFARRKFDEPFRARKGFAPPEQYGQEPVIDELTDIYAFGAVLFYMTVNRNPAIEQSRLPNVKEIVPEISDRFAKVIYKATEPDRTKRYHGMAQVMDEMRALSNCLPEDKTEKGKKPWLSKIFDKKTSADSQES